jgi:hypothetical protein
VKKWKGGKMEIGKKYLIIYDDKNYKPTKKIGIITAKENNLITLDNREILNINNIIRAEVIQ